MIHLDQLIAVNIDPPILIFELSFNEEQLILLDQILVQMLDQMLMQFNTYAIGQSGYFTSTKLLTVY